MATHKHMSFLILIFALLTVGDSGNGSCVESEKQALLLLKESLIDDLSYLSSWTGDDCCAWHGIGCNNRTRHVIQLDLRDGLLKGDHLYPSLLDLKHLTYLDLSNNSFGQMKIPQFLGSFKDLTYLNLSYSSFEGLVPHHLGNLSKLRYLDLSNNYNYHNIDYDDFDIISLSSINSMRWLSGLSMLKHLDLSYVNLSTATDWFSSLNMLSNSISVLRLGYCQLSNNIPRHLPFINLTSLVSFNIEYNNLNSSFPLWVLNNSGLVQLKLASNHFDGSIPDSIGTLTSLLDLDLSDNKFNGLIPESIGRLKSLSSLHVANNKFEGLLPKSIGNLTALSNLYLFDNKLTGLIPEDIGYLTSLIDIDLSKNNFKGLIPHSIGNLSKLVSLAVSRNHLSGNIPECIGELSKLQWLALDSNSGLEGFVTERHFVNLTMLTDLDISSESNLSLNVSLNWVPPFQLKHISIESVKVGPKFPHWLLTQRQINAVKMKNTSISDTIPADWFASLLSRATIVDLSNNDISVGQLSSISGVPNGLVSLALSNNRLSGEFPLFLCNIASLETLVISNNKFSGELPHCLGNLTKLRNFDVMNNSFSGDIPVSLGSLVNLTYLNLHKNKFQGKLPMSFQNLKELVALDVGKNNLSDILPPWSGEQLPQLKYLILRSNNFFGEIPTQLCHYPSIQVLNLAKNKIRGRIPPCFGNFSAMITGDNNDKFKSFHGEMIMDDTKGYELKYTSTLMFLYSIDLSNNNISGEIPQELVNLRALLNLNLAGNHLAGRIPERIGKLDSLEYLDLSRNKLYGHIPQSLSDLHFLSSLNLSFNELTGRIPTGYQLQTLDNPSIYAGNKQLCGQPILKPCTDDPDSRNTDDYDEADADSDDERMWVYAGIGPGLLVGFLGFCGSLHFIKSWRYSYFHAVELVFDKVAIAVALWQRKFQNWQTSMDSGRSSSVAAVAPEEEDVVKS